MINKIHNFIFILKTKTKDILDDRKKIYRILDTISRLLDSKIIRRTYKYYNRQGINICYFLSTSHIIYSSYPEYNIAIIEASICTKPHKLKELIKYLKKNFDCKSLKIKKYSIRLK